MKRKLLELKNSRTEQIKAAEKALTDGDGAAYDAAMKQVGEMNAEIDKIEKLLGEQTRYSDPTKAPQMPMGDPKPQEDTDRSKQLKELRGSNEYVRAFVKALCIGARPDTYVEAIAPLYKALTISGGDPIGSDGGFLVPIDFQTRVQMLSKDYVDLSAFAHRENVSVMQGWRNIETSAARAPFPLVEEDSAITAATQPTFRRINYSCKRYGDRLGVSGELMQNADGLMSYLAEWYAPRYVATKNSLILALLDALDLNAITGANDAAKVKAIKSVLNKGLITAHSRLATLVTNANGYDAMDNWADNDGKPFLKPDLSGDFEHFKGRRVVYGDVDIIPDIQVEEKTYSPIYIGNIAAFAALFEHNGMTMDATNIGGDAWRKGGWEIRALCAMDCKQVDPSAVVKCGVELA